MGDTRIIMRDPDGVKQIYPSKEAGIAAGAITCDEYRALQETKEPDPDETKDSEPDADPDAGDVSAQPEAQEKTGTKKAKSK